MEACVGGVDGACRVRYKAFCRFTSAPRPLRQDAIYEDVEHRNVNYNNTGRLLPQYTVMHSPLFFQALQWPYITKHLGESLPVSEIKVLLRAFTRCTYPRNHAPGRLFVCYSLNKPKIEEKHAHTRCTGFKTHAPGSKIVHTGCRVHP